jgi:hypothetical protein
MMLRNIGGTPDYAARTLAFYEVARALPSNVPRINAGKQEPDGFTVAADIAWAATSVVLKVSTTPSLDGLVYTSSPTATTETDGGIAGKFWSVMFPVTGLSAHTTYYYRLDLDGEPDIIWRQIKTAPAEGVATAFGFDVTSCSNITPRINDFNIMSKCAELGSDFHLQIGDIQYFDNTVNDIGKIRANCPRIYLHNAQVKSVLNLMGFEYDFDDHDCVSNDGLWEDFAAVMATVRQVVDEIMPHHTYADGGSSARCRARHRRYGKCSFIHLDNRSQATLLGTKSGLGNGTYPPGSFDQVQWVKDTIDACVSAGDNRIFIVSPSGVFPNGAGGVDGTWRRINEGEVLELAAYAHANAPGLVDWICGDHHFCAFDDGDCMGGYGQRLIVSSAAYKGHGNTYLGIAKWNGVESGHFGNRRGMVHLEVLEDGNWIGQFWGRRNLTGASATDVEIVLHATYDTRDLAV